ncbi:nuclear transport factor 2 family protein [Parasphingopyxis marina]|uniref:Nuclear transport factor 2 family protein n=1 Tax=Parasphingopyxis marina TaxID=2761622 RepID=A0A842HUD0_9SPHN|nr:nuclear transport factor 2 family protein [Parasphingopyxis marina]MBC2776017.1 nuclear transport factor 2 family protein [Parasphingopyxis marina]
MFDYNEYIRVFCTGDDEALVDRFFNDNLVFTGGTRIHHGKQGLKEFLDWAHDGVREVPRVQHWARDGDMLFADVDMDFHATKERPDFPFGHLHPGDSVTVKFHVTYRLEDEKISALNSMTWAPEYGVTKLPKLGGHPSQVAAYMAYGSAFSNADHERYSQFYTDDATLQLSTMPLIEGKQGIIDFYTPMFQRVREHLTIHKLLADDEAIFGDTTSRFTAVEDSPEFVVAPLAKGESVEVRVFVLYTLREGLISSIKVARAGELERLT